MVMIDFHYSDATGLTIDEDDFKTITCSNGLISITSASYYANDGEYCSADVKSYLTRCNNKYHCKVTASNDELGGNPCRHHVKALYVHYKCM